MPKLNSPISGIQKAFDDFLTTNAPSLGFDFVFPGTDYSPTEGNPYAHGENAGRSQVKLGPGKDAPVQHSGTYQVMVMSPVSEGLQGAQKRADSVANLFPIGMTLSVSGGDVVKIEMLRIPSEIPNGYWLQIPVMIDWSYIQF